MFNFWMDSGPRHSKRRAEMLLIALITLLLTITAAGTTTVTTVAGTTIAGSTTTDATAATDAPTTTDAGTTTVAATPTDAAATNTTGAAATNATTTPAATTPAATTPAAITPAATTPAATTPTATKPDATTVNTTTVNATSVNTTTAATTTDVETTEIEPTPAQISNKPSESPTTTNEMSMEPQSTEPGPTMETVGPSAVPPIPAPSVIPSTARPSTRSTTTRSTTVGGLTVPPTVPSSWPQLDPPNVTVSTGQSYLYQIGVGTMQTVQAGAHLLYDFMSEGLKMRKSGMPNSWISLGGSDTKVVRVRVRQFHPNGNAQSPWSNWRTNPDHMSAVDAVIRFGKVDRTTCATMLQNPPQLLGFERLVIPFIHDHLSNHAIVSQIGDVSFAVKNISCGSLIVKATIGALVDQPDAVLETALTTNIRGKTIDNLEITEIQTMETDASSTAFVVRQFNVKRVNKTMLHFGWSLVGADGAAEHVLITCEKTSKEGTNCSWVMDNYQSIPPNTEMLSLNCETMCDTINGEYKFSLHVKIPVQGGLDRLPSFDSNLETVARFTTCGLNSMCDYDENSETCGCLCDEGYTHNTDLDICEDITDDCAGGACSTVENSRCVDGPAMADCVCNSGFHMIGGMCMDMDECYMGTPCDKGMLCMNTPGAFSCSCPDKTQWLPFNETCIDKNECATPEGNMCLSRHGTHSTCFNTVGNLTSDPYYRCECEPGYTSNYNGTCVEKNECTEDLSICSSVDHSMCVNTMGSYECECLEGYVKSGDFCTDADSCASSPCPSGRCTDGVGTYTCHCNGTESLQADNTCITLSSCTSNSSCTLSASYCESGSCTCKPGLVLKHIGNRTICDNINECEMGIDTCADNEVCIDDIPGYKCSPRLSCLCNGNEDCNDKGKCYMPLGGKCLVKTFHSDIYHGIRTEQGCAHSEHFCGYSSYQFSMGCCNRTDCNTKSSAPSLGTTVNVTYIDVTPENEADAIFRLQPIPPNQNAVITSVTVLCQSDCALFSPLTHSFNGTHLVIPNIHPGSAPHTAHFVMRSLILHGVNPLLQLSVHFAPTLTDVNVTQISDDDFHITWTTTRTDPNFVLTVAAVCGQSDLKCNPSRMVVPADGVVRMSSILTPGMKYVLKFEAHFMQKVSPPTYRDITYSINECLPNMMINHTCAHEKACVDTPESFECLKVLPCFPGLCKNSVCNDTDKGFDCVCNAGFMQDLTDSTHTNCIERTYCEKDNPCMNGGTCSEGTESFTCDCTDTGFTGRACNEITLFLPVNETVFSPLRNTTIDKEKEEVDFQFCTNSELHCNKMNSQCILQNNLTVTDVFNQTYVIPGLCQCSFPYVVELNNRCELGSCKCGGLNAKGCDQNGFCTSMETQCYTKTELGSNRQVEYSQGCIQSPAEKNDVCIGNSGGQNYLKIAQCCTVSPNGNIPCNYINEESVNQYPMLDKVNVTVRDVGTMADVVFIFSPPVGVQVINTTFTCTENCDRETYTLGGDVFNKTVTPTGIDRSRRIRYMFAFVFANAMDVHLNVSVMPSPPRVVEAQLTANARMMHATWRLQRKPDGTLYTKTNSVVTLYCVPLSDCENRTTTVSDRYEWTVNVVQGLKYALDVHTASHGKTTPVFTSTPAFLPITTRGLTNTRATTTYLVLGWSYNDDNAKISNCKVSYPGGLASTVQGKRTHFQLNNLTPDHRYEVSVECCSAKQPTCVYGPKSTSRMYTMPGTITDPKLLRISSSKATLKWTLPKGYSVQSDVSVLSSNHLPLTKKHLQLFANKSGCHLKDLRSSSRYSLVVRLSSRYPGQGRGGAKTFKFDTLAEGVFSGIEPWLWVMIGVGAVVMLIALLLLLSICFFTADKPRIDPDIDFIYNRSRHSTVAAEEAMTK